MIGEQGTIRAIGVIGGENGLQKRGQTALMSVGSETWEIGKPGPARSKDYSTSEPTAE